MLTRQHSSPQMQQGKMKEHAPKKPLKTCLILLAIVLIIAGWIKYRWETTYKWYRVYTPIPFSAEIWDRDISKRVHMIESLIHDYNGLVGMTQAEVTELLGTNTGTENDGGGRYVVGNLGGSHEDGILMEFWYGSDGICDGFTLRQGYTLLGEYGPWADNALEADD